jgi:hypothetical protein
MDPGRPGDGRALWDRGGAPRDHRDSHRPISWDPAEPIVEGIARGSGHIIGVTCMASDLTPKRLQLLKEAVPSIHRVAMFCNPFDPNKAGEIQQM